MASKKDKRDARRNALAVGASVGGLLGFAVAGIVEGVGAGAAVGGVTNVGIGTAALSAATESEPENDNAFFQGLGAGQIGHGAANVGKAAMKQIASWRVKREAEKRAAKKD